MASELLGRNFKIYIGKSGRGRGDKAGTKNYSDPTFLYSILKITITLQLIVLKKWKGLPFLRDEVGWGILLKKYNFSLLNCNVLTPYIYIIYVVE